MGRKKGKNFDNESNSAKVDCAFDVFDPCDFPPLSGPQMSNINRTTLSRENQDIKHRTTDPQYDSNYVSNTQRKRQTKYRSIYSSSVSINLCRTSSLSCISDIPADRKLSYNAAASGNSDRKRNSYQNTHNSNISCINVSRISRNKSCEKKSDNYDTKYQFYDGFVPYSSAKKGVVNYQNVHSSIASRKTSGTRFGSLEKYEFYDLYEQQIENNARASVTGKNHHNEPQCIGTSDSESFEAEFDTILKCIGYSSELFDMINSLLEKKKGYSLQNLLSRVNSRQDLIDSLCVCNYLTDNEDQSDETVWKYSNIWDLDDSRDDEWDPDDCSDDELCRDYCNDDEWDLDKDLKYICPYHFLLECVSLVLQLERTEGSSLTECSLSSCDETSVSSGCERSNCRGQEVVVVNKSSSYSDKERMQRDASREGCSVRSKRGSLGANEVKMEGMKRREKKKKQTVVKDKCREEKKTPDDFQNVGNALKEVMTSKGEITEKDRFPIEDVEETQNKRECQTNRQNAAREPKARRKAKVKNKKARILREIKQHRIRRSSQSKADQSLMKKTMID